MIKINRRILDNVSITALDKHGDPELTKSVSDLFGVGTLVEDAKISQVTFNKSMLGLSTTNISSTIRKLSNQFKSEAPDASIVDSDGTRHMVNSNVVNLLKAIVFYSIACPPILSNCVRTVLSEVDAYFRDGDNKPLVTISMDDSGTVEEENKHLTAQCRKEIFDLLKEAGVSIG